MALKIALKIALLTYSTQPRGSVVHTLELAQALADLGHIPCVFALDKGGRGFHRSVGFATCAVPARACDSNCDSNTDELIRQRIKEFVDFFESLFEQGAETYDIYHAQDCLSANALAVLKGRGKLSQFVRTVHHVEDFKSPYLKACQEKSIYLSDRVLCVSELWQRVIEADYGLQAHRVFNGVSSRFSACPNGRELNESESALAERYGIEGDPIYLTIGGIEPRKNSINLLEAFRAVHRCNPAAQLVIAGGATLFDYQDYRDEFLTKLKIYGLTESVRPLGVVPDDDLPGLYRLADAFVFPSVKEGWGLVVLEAIASGLPVLTSNQAPFTEFLSQRSARLVNPTDVDAIALAMLEIVEPEVAQSLVNHSRFIAERYSWKASALAHLELYEQMVEVV
jgi:glycosyltransferase-like protein